jgi:hypothetical protein
VAPLLDDLEARMRRYDYEGALDALRRMAGGIGVALDADEGPSGEG